MKSSRRRIAFELLEMRRVLASDYFLKIEGIPGESTDARYPGAIELDSFSWGAASDQRSGPASPLSTEEFRFVTSIGKATPKLMETVSNGTHISSALLYVRKEGNPDQEYLKIKLTDLIVSSAQSQSLNEGLPKEEYSFSFKRIDQTYIPMGDDGTVGEPVTSSWTVPRRTTFVAPEKGLLDELVSPNEDQLDAFLKIPGIRGDSLDAKHKEWIHIESFSWGLSQSERAGVGGAGRATLQDFHFVSSVSKASPVLAKAVADGAAMDQAVLHVRRAGSDDVFLKIKLTDLIVSSYQTRGTSDTEVMEEFSLQFSEARQAYYPQSATGAVGQPIVVDLHGSLRNAPATHIKLIDKTVAEPATSDFFLAVSGIPGESTDAKHKGEIAIESFSWGLSNQNYRRSGGGAGKVNVQDFSFVSAVNAASPALMSAVATGTKFDVGSLVVRQSGGDQKYQVYKLEMKEVLISSYQTRSENGSTPSERVSLNFAKIKFDYVEANAAGQPGDTTSIKWTVPANAERQANTILMPEIIASPPGERAASIYLKLDGIDGDSSHKAHKNEIEVLSYRWGINIQQVTGGGGSGKVSLQDFHFVAASGKATPALINAAFGGTGDSGGAIGRGVLSVRRADNESTPTVRYKLADVIVSSYDVSSQNGSAPAEELALNFAKLEMRYSRQDATGQVKYTVDGRVTETPRMDRERGPSILSSTEMPAGTHEASLAIEGINGDSASDGSAGAIAIESFSWGVSQGTSVGSGGGAGKVSLQDFHFVTSSSSASPELVEALREGRQLRDVLLNVQPKGQSDGGKLKYQMKEVFVTGYRAKGEEGHEQLEEIAINFIKFSNAYRAGGDGSVGDSSMQWTRKGQRVNRLPGDSIIDQTNARPASADYFLKLGDIRGSSVADGFEGAIDVKEFEWGVSRTMSSLGGRPIGRPVYDNFDFAIDYDKASPILMRALAAKTSFAESSFVARNRADSGYSYLKYELSDVLVSSFGVAANGDGGVTNRFSLNAGAVDVVLSPPAPQRLRTQDAGEAFFAWRFDELLEEVSAGEVFDQASIQRSSIAAASDSAIGVIESHSVAKRRTSVDQSFGVDELVSRVKSSSL